MNTSLPDFELCELVYDSIYDTYGYDEIVDGEAQLNEEENTVFQIWSVGGFIDTNGFVGLWSLNPDYTAFIDSLKRIGKENQASVVMKSIEVFSGSELPKDGIDVTDFFGSDDKAEEHARAFQREYWSLGEHDKPLADYIRKNSENLGAHLKRNQNQSGDDNSE